ncbi:hypothetical protein [Pseudomonas fulva]|uniref:hypothetical protein n=1 Tax=Pseudomonas fulva TaxID=47880 RepID=UPI00384FC5C8
MRVPLYDHDLETKGGFKRIAKKLQKNWPHSEPIKLTNAMEILARALGYQSYFHAHRSVNSPSPQKIPDLQPAKERLKFLVLTHPQDMPTSPEAINEMVEGLPWHALQATSPKMPQPTFTSKASPTREAVKPNYERVAEQEKLRPAPIIIIKRRRLTNDDTGGEL